MCLNVGIGRETPLSSVKSSSCIWGFIVVMQEYGRSSIGFEENVVAVATYFGFVGLILFFVEKRSNFVRFHAVQSTLSFTLLMVFWLAVKWIHGLSFLSWAPGLSALIFTSYMMLKAYDGEEFKLPVLGKLAFCSIYEVEQE